METHADTKPKRASRRGFIAALGGGLAALAAQVVHAPRAEAAAGGNMILGADNDSGTAETILRSDPNGDKASFIVFNDTGTLAAGHMPDGLRAFAVGPNQGAAVQAFAGAGSFAQAPFDGIGVRARGKKAGLVAEVLNTLNVAAAAITGRTDSGASQPGTRVIGVWGVESQDTTYGDGVLGESPGGQGRGVTGLSGYTESSVGSSGPPGAGVWGVGTSFGVYGNVQTAGAVAVRGDAAVADGTGGFFQGQTGVEAIANVAGGTAIVAFANPEAGDDLFALQARGKAKFKNVGTATIPRGATSVDVAVQNLSDAVVLATLQTSTGSVAVRSAARVDDATIRVRLTAAPTKSVSVGWMVVYPSV